MTTSTAARPIGAQSAQSGLNQQADPVLLARARRDYALIMRRRRLLGGELFPDPAWSMLLDLFISGSAGRRLSVSALCIGSHCPHSTALRYASLLADAGLVEREEDATDARRRFVQLTTEGWKTMRDLLSA